MDEIIETEAYKFILSSGSYNERLYDDFGMIAYFRDNNGVFWFNRDYYETFYNNSPTYFMSRDIVKTILSVELGSENDLDPNEYIDWITRISGEIIDILIKILKEED